MADPVRASLAQAIKQTEEYLEGLRRQLADYDRISGKQPQLGEFGATSRPLDAISALLVREDKPLDRETISKALRAGGFQASKHDWQANRNIMASIGRSLQEGSLKERKKLVGLSEWPWSKWP